MSQLTISLPDILEAALARRMTAAGYQDKALYLLELVRADCEAAELDAVLESRIAGPFAPLESDWKERVRTAARE